jgi:hypothetical protein
MTRRHLIPRSATHHDHRPIVLGDRHWRSPGRVDQFAEVILRVGRCKLAHAGPRAAGAVLAKLAESAISPPREAVGGHLGFLGLSPM